MEETERKALKLLDINMNTSKTILFKQGFGEFTSWYQDGDFIVQYGVVTSTLRPKGKNPMDDLFTIAKSTSVSQQRLEMNTFGAEAKIRLGIDNRRRLRRINKHADKREGVSGDVVLLADGGSNPWSAMCCHLEETSLQENDSTTQEEKGYLLRIRHPYNLFVGEAREEITYSVEKSKIVTELTEIPGTVFHYVNKTNRTKKTKGTTTADMEDASIRVLEVLESADLTCKIKKPCTRQPMVDYTLSYLKQMRSLNALTSEGNEKYEKAIALLEDRIEAPNEVDYNDCSHFPQSPFLFHHPILIFGNPF